MTTTCTNCGGSADVTANPARLTLPPYHGKCSNCGHEWNFDPQPPTDRRLGL